MQRSAGISEPDYGQLLDSMVVHSGARLDTAAYIVPRLETELAFYLNAPLKGPNAVSQMCYPRLTGLSPPLSF